MGPAEDGNNAVSKSELVVFAPRPAAVGLYSTTIA
jgi:hypothetical protein